MVLNFVTQCAMIAVQNWNRFYVSGSKVCIHQALVHGDAEIIKAMINRYVAVEERTTTMTRHKIDGKSYKKKRESDCR